jgi:hypothetical protein
LSIKCLFNLALRQSLGLVESLLRLASLDWSVPDFSTVCRRQKTLRVQLPDRASTTALDLLVDSTGIKFLRRWWMEAQEARGRVPAAVAQGVPGD